MKRFACLALAFGLAPACGDDGASSPDAAPPDAPEIDAPIDAPPPPRFAAELSVIEASQLNPAGVAAAIFGQGLQVRIVFTDATLLPTPMMEEQPGVPAGCKAWEYTTAQVTAATVGLDQGPVDLSFVAGTAPAIPPVVPTCSFAAPGGYNCLDMTTAGTGGAIVAAGGQGTLTVTAPAMPFTAANSLGRYIRIRGAGTPGNNGLFPINLRPSASAVRYVNATAANEPTTPASYVHLAGVGPIPGQADPGFVAEDSMLVVTHRAGGDGQIPDFNLRTAAPGHLGDDFTLDAASTTLLRQIPRTGEAMTFTCETGCAAFNAPGSQVDLITTDAPLMGLTAFAMPLPVTKRVHVRCVAPGASVVTVPAEYSAKLTTAGATRIQATFTRAATVTLASPPVTTLAGHSIVGVTTVP
jgi:hypothetical protein